MSQISDLRFTRVVGRLAGSVAYGTGWSVAEGSDEEDELDTDQVKLKGRQETSVGEADTADTFASLESGIPCLGFQESRP